MTRPRAYVTAHRVADDMEPRFRSIFQRALASARYQTVPLADLEAMAARKDMDGLLYAIPWGEFSRVLYQRMEQAVIAGIVDSAHAHARDLAVGKRVTNVSADFGFSFDKTNPRALQSAARQAFDLIVDLVEGSKQAIRDLITRLFEQQGETVQSIARQIRAHIGLTRTQSGALLNQRLSLLEQVGEGALTPARASELEDQYRLRLLAQRAETVARTETMRASNTGQQLVWQGARDAGFLEPEQKRIWLVTPDERLCPICAPIPDKGPVGLEEPFEDGDGNLQQQPPAHPHCRCTTALYFEDS